MPKVCAERGITVASHDDATLAHVDEAIDNGVRLAEFPTSFDAAQGLARSAGMSVLMGAPNIVRGKSHSGNIAARDLAERGVLDVLSSDYVPLSLLHAPFVLADERRGYLAAEGARHGHLDARPHRRPGRSRPHRHGSARRYRRASTAGWRAGRPRRVARRAAGRLMDTAPAEYAARSGCMVAVVGPSGAGKDTLMAYAARVASTAATASSSRAGVITRDASAGGENHDGVVRGRVRGRWNRPAASPSRWGAHGLLYGIPAETKDAVAAGQLVIANGFALRSRRTSRSSLSRGLWSLISPRSLDVLARPARSAWAGDARGYSGSGSNASSLAVGGDYHVVTIDNSGLAGRCRQGALIEALQRTLLQTRRTILRKILRPVL